MGILTHAHAIPSRPPFLGWGLVRGYYKCNYALINYSLIILFFLILEKCAYIILIKNPS